ncbi:type II toxin-antitoxin system RelE/ParE family toxin [Thiomicrorhabdus sp. 6S2-11]|uniref:Type II toxin-antitoxin system RelE/ParE family toxin n=1 Tax=Thiomicrorhabdus marina TaxID=2818442 RepID=A0ABS3Q1N5_9GAMM|nr:type II toxin-antitoxin system RelE/ParE family toxin [Thiomicrorhabdus marina]MBO1926232.1 type II toxin-antitoxin system RelE/ParE family toxin [Thiomicrorhabdus marina]
MEILQKPTFKRAYKKLYPNQRKSVNEAIKQIISDPQLGTEKKGDLQKVFVYKFDCVNQQYLLAYEWDEKSRTLLMLGVHENFYRNLKAL